jgi:hypothetical protein
MRAQPGDRPSDDRLRRPVIRRELGHPCPRPSTCTRSSAIRDGYAPTGDPCARAPWAPLHGASIARATLFTAVSASSRRPPPERHWPPSAAVSAARSTRLPLRLRRSRPCRSPARWTAQAVRASASPHTGWATSSGAARSRPSAPVPIQHAQNRHTGTSSPVRLVTCVHDGDALVVCLRLRSRTCHHNVSPRPVKGCPQSAAPGKTRQRAEGIHWAFDGPP